MIFAKFVVNAVLLSFFIFCSSAKAEYPEKVIKLIVSFPPGSSTDLVARALQDPLSQALGQNVVIENRAGAEGYVGAAYAANSAGDGYTLLVAPTGVFVTPLLRRKPLYDPRKDFSPIGLIGEFSAPMLVVSSNSRIHNFPQFISEIKQTEMFYGTGNISGILAGEQLRSLLGVKVVQVPYKGEAEALGEMLAGRVDWMFVLPTVAGSFIDGGKIRPLLTTSLKRDPFFSNVPSVSEFGRVDLANWQEIGSLVALMGPANLPKDISKKISQALFMVLQKNEVRERLKKIVFHSNFSNSEELSRLIDKKIDTWNSLIERNGIKKID